MVNDWHAQDIMKYKIPTHLIAYFEFEALKNIGNTGEHIETLALGLGKKENDTLFLEELIFPSQDASSSHVEDKGIQGQETSLWISENSYSFKQHGNKAA